MNLTPVLRHRYFNSNGSPLAGGKLYTYQAGTTTPQATYTDSGGLTPNTNPVILDANGEASVWVDPSLSYKYVLKDSGDVTQWTVDNVIGLLTANSVATASLQDLSVTTAKLAAKAVDSTKLASDASVDGNRAVTTDHIRDAAIKSAKLAADVIDAMTAVTSVASGDELLVYSAANSANRKVTVDNFKKTPTSQRFTTGTSLTYTTPSGVRWIKVTMCGGGGGGGGGAGTGGAGGTTTFGTSLLTATGGAGGDIGAVAGGAGGTATINAPAATIVVAAGAYGNGGPATGTTFQNGSSGGANAFGGAGAGGQANGGGQPAIANTGAGGGGGGNGASGSACSGGGAGGYLQAVISNPSASYTYTVGAGGSGVASSGAIATGGGGGSGVIIVEEFY